jgi:hypothetical protein
LACREVARLRLLLFHQAANLGVEGAYRGVEFIQAGLCLSNRTTQLRDLRGDARERCGVLCKGSTRRCELRRESALLCNERVKSLLLRCKLSGERLLLRKGVIKGISTDWAGLCQAEADDEQRNGQ